MNLLLLSLLDSKKFKVKNISLRGFHQIKEKQ